MPHRLVGHFEEAIGQGKILVSFEVGSREELGKDAATFYKIGASDMHETEVLVA